MHAQVLFVTGVTLAILIPNGLVLVARAEDPAHAKPEKRAAAAQPESDRQDSIAARLTAVIPLQHRADPGLERLLREALFGATRRGGPRPGVQYDPWANALIISGEPEFHESVRTLVAELDVPVGHDAELLDPAPPTVLEVQVYEIEAGFERIAAIEVSDLADHAASATDLYKALQEFGAPRLRYRAEQVVRLNWDGSRRGSELLSVGNRAPFMRSSQITDSGLVNSFVEYQSIGCRVALAGTWRTATQGVARVQLELSSLAPASVTLTNDIAAPLYRQVEQQFDGAFTAGRPIILLSADSRGDERNATAYVTRLVLDRVE